MYVWYSISLGPQTIGVQCPIIFSLGEFQVVGIGSGILGYSPCWCPSTFHSPSISRCFSNHYSSTAIGLHACFFFTTDVSAPIRSTLHLLTLLGEFRGLELALVPDVGSQRRSRGSHEAKISFQISVLAGV